MIHHVKINKRSLHIMLWLYTQERLKNAGVEGLAPEMGLEVSQENKRGKKDFLDGGNSICTKAGP